MKRSISQQSMNPPESGRRTPDAVTQRPAFLRTLSIEPDSPATPGLAFDDDPEGKSPRDRRPFSWGRPSPRGPPSPKFAAAPRVCRVHLSAMTRPCWLRRVVANQHRHAIEQRRIDGVEEDATIQHERAIKF